MTRKRVPSLKPLQRFTLSLALSADDERLIKRAAERRNLRPQLLVKKILRGELSEREILELGDEISEALVYRLFDLAIAERDRIKLIAARAKRT